MVGVALAAGAPMIVPFVWMHVSRAESKAMLEADL